MKEVTMEYNYRLIVFMKRSKKKTKEIEIVPSIWLYSNKLSSALLCKFILGPYNNERAKKYMVKNGLSPENHWPSYLVEFVGRAHK